MTHVHAFGCLAWKKKARLAARHISLRGAGGIHLGHARCKLPINPLRGTVLLAHHRSASCGAGGISRHAAGINLECAAARHGIACALPLRLCGAGGIRTLVQTTVPRAFYMLILSLVFDRPPGKGTLGTA